MPLINLNQFDYTATGIHIMRSYYNLNNIQIVCNNIGLPTESAAYPPNFPFTNNHYINQGISVEDMLGSTSGTPTNAIYIAANNVYNATKNCIYASNVKQGLYIFGNGNGGINGPNHFSTLPALTLGPNYIPHVNIACIETDNCQNGSMKCNSNLYYNGPSPTPSSSYGVLVYQSNYMVVEDNSTHNIYNGFCFSGPCNPCSFGNCEMLHTHYAFVLNNSYIGQQGSPGSPVAYSWSTFGGGNTWATANLGNSPDPNYFTPMIIYANVIPPPNKNAGGPASTTPSCPMAPGTRYFSNISNPFCYGFNGQPGMGVYSGCNNVPQTTQGVCGSHVSGKSDSAAAAKLTAPQMALTLLDTVATDTLSKNRIWHNQRYLWERIY